MPTFSILSSFLQGNRSRVTEISSRNSGAHTSLWQISWAGLDAHQKLVALRSGPTSLSR